MKIRLGFVSNSSSASFTLIIHANKKTIANILEDWRDVIKQTYQDKLSLLNEEMEKLGKLENIENKFSDFLKSCKKNIGEELKLLKRKLKNKNYNIFDFLISQNINVTEKSGFTVLSYVTVMYNDDSDIPIEMKKIEQRMKERDIPVIFNIHEDN